MVSQGSGTHNEDGFGTFERDGVLEAAWILDGVTGINPKPILPAASDAVWIVERTQVHLKSLAGGNMPILTVLESLVDELKRDWLEVTHDLVVPPDYDMPATCLTLVKKYLDGWQLLRLGDSLVLTGQRPVQAVPLPPSDLEDLEARLKNEAQKQRAAGALDYAALRAAFYPLLRENRRRRNTPGSYSVLVPDRSALAIPQTLALGFPDRIVLCTDGYYRSVDHYGLVDDEGLVAACGSQGGMEGLLARIRLTEANDPDCLQYLRFKTADDATALCLMS